MARRLNTGLIGALFGFPGRQAKVPYVTFAWEDPFSGKPFVNGIQFRLADFSTL